MMKTRIKILSLKMVILDISQRPFHHYYVNLSLIVSLGDRPAFQETHVPKIKDGLPRALDADKTIILLWFCVSLSLSDHGKIIVHLVMIVRLDITYRTALPSKGL